MGCCLYLRPYWAAKYVTEVAVRVFRSRVTEFSTVGGLREYARELGVHTLNEKTKKQYNKATLTGIDDRGS